MPSLIDPILRKKIEEYQAQPAPLAKPTIPSWMQQPPLAAQILGPAGYAIPWGLEQAEKLFTGAGATLTAPFRPLPEGYEAFEKPKGWRSPSLPTSFTPGGAQYEAYKQWKGGPKEPYVPLGVPSWEQWGGMLGLGEKPETYKPARMGLGDIAELAPWMFVGGPAGGRAAIKAGEMLEARTPQLVKTALKEEAGMAKLPKLKPEAKLPITPSTIEQRLVGHRVAEDVGLLNKQLKPTQAYRDFAISTTGKDSMTNMTSAEADDFIRAMGGSEIKLPIEGVSDAVAKRKVNGIANELAHYMGVVTREPRVITAAAVKEGAWHRIGEKFGGFLNRTYRVEPMLYRLDGYKPNGKFTQTFYKPVDTATNNKMRGIMGGQERFMALLKENKINLRDLMKGQETIAEGVKLSPSEKIGVYLHSRNPDNLLHLTAGNKFSDDTIRKVVDSLTPAERMVADWMASYFQREGPALANVVKSATGKTMPIVENYFPIRLQWKAFPQLSFEQQLEREATFRFTSKYATSKIRKGFIQPRTHKATQPVDLDATSVFINHLEGVEHYKAFSPVVRDLQRALNNQKFKNTLIGKEGKAIHEVLDRWLKDIAKTNPLGATNHAESILRQLRVNSVTAVLGLNLTTAMKQFPSFVTGAAEVGEWTALKGLFTYLADTKGTTALLRELSPQIYKRSFEREIAEAALMKGVEKRIAGKMSPREIFMILTTSMDRLAVRSLWRGAYDDALKGSPRVLKSTGKTKGETLSSEEAAEYASRSIRRTQPYFSVKDLAEYWRSGEFAKALTIFTNQLNQYWNYYRFYTAGAAKAGTISKGETVRKVIEGFVVPALMIGAISRSQPAQDAKEFATDLGSMAMATIPILGHFITGGFQGFYGGQGLITTEVLDRLQEFAYNTNKGQWDKVAQLMPELGGYAAGIPVAQPRRTIKAMIDLANGKTGDLMELIWGSYAREKVMKEHGGVPSQIPFVPPRKSPAQQLEDRVWAQYPQYKEIADRIRELEKTDPIAARALQRQYPQILNIRRQILLAQGQQSTTDRQKALEQAMKQREAALAGR